MHVRAKQKPRLKGRYKVELIRNGRVIKKHQVPNGIVDVGLELLLDVMFGGTAASAGWFIGIINNASFTALANADTMASHAGWIEFAGYSEADRQEWIPGAAASRQITNPIVAEFNINAASVVLKGIFIADDDTKSGASGTLWSTAAFPTLINATIGDVLRITYTLAG